MPGDSSPRYFGYGAAALRVVAIFILLSEFALRISAFLRPLAALSRRRSGSEFGLRTSARRSYFLQPFILYFRGLPRKFKLNGLHLERREFHHLEGGQDHLRAN
jgi:hypothetical protein